MNRSNCACIHFMVSGRVQGVFFRASTADKAQALGVTGWVRNLPDGRVEGVACADESGLEAFQRWLAEGPPHAKVEDVVVNSHPQEVFLNFDVRYF